MKQMYYSRMLILILLFASIISEVKSLPYNKNCYKVPQIFGDPTADTDVIETDLDIIKQLTDPETYHVASLAYCFRDNKLVS